MVVNDIVDDIGSGVLLCKLAMLLTMKKIRYQRNPKMVFQVRILSLIQLELAYLLHKKGDLLDILSKCEIFEQLILIIVFRYFL